MARMKASLSGSEGSIIGLAIAFFTLAGSQGEPRPIVVFGLILITPLVLLGTGLTRRPWLAAAYLILLGVLTRAFYMDRPPDSDVLPVTHAAIDRMLRGNSPYGLMYSVPPFFGPGNPFAYPPGNLLYYLPGFLLDSVRSTEVFSSAVVLAGLAWVAWLIRSDWPVATMGLYAAAPPLILLATDGSNDTSAGALLFVSALLLFLSKRRSNGWLLIASALLMGETLAFKQYTLPFWLFLTAYVAAQPWRLSKGIYQRTFSIPAWIPYAIVSAGYAGAVSLPFFLTSPATFLDDVVFVSRFSSSALGIDRWNVWSFMLRWKGWNADKALGDSLVPIDLTVMGFAIVLGLLAGVGKPSRSLLFGAGAWFLVMLFARWTTYASFAGVAPIVLLIPFADRLADPSDSPEAQMTRQTTIALERHPTMPPSRGAALRE